MSNLRERMQQATSAAPSMVPGPAQEPEIKEPPPPDIRDVVVSKVDLELAMGLIKAHAVHGAVEAEARKAKRPLTAQIKKVMAAWEVTRAIYDGIRISYFCTYWSSVDTKLLLKCGVSPEIIKACTVTKPRYTLRITPPGVEEEDEESKW